MPAGDLISDFGFAINEGLFYQDNPQSAIRNRQSAIRNRQSAIKSPVRYSGSKLGTPLPPPRSILRLP